MAQGRSTKIITMIKWIRTSRLSIKNSLSAPKLPKKPHQYSCVHRMWTRGCLHGGRVGALYPKTSAPSLRISHSPGVRLVLFHIHLHFLETGACCGASSCVHVIGTVATQCTDAQYVFSLSLCLSVSLSCIRALSRQSDRVRGNP